MAPTNILLESGTNELEIVEFFLDEELPDGEVYRGYFGVNVAKVLEIIRMPAVTEMPEVSDSSVLGAFSQRSRITPLVDLGVWLGRTRVEREEPKVVVTEFNNLTTAFLVSGVNRIHRISWEDVEPPTNYVSALSEHSITGVVKMNGRIIFILDLEKIMAELNPKLGLKLDEALDWSGGEEYRALVADDSSLIRSMLKDLLERAKFKVRVVSNGLEAWEALLEVRDATQAENKSLREYLDVVVTDIEMPKMDGHHLTRRIREDPVLRELPVILFSSLITDKLRHKGDAVGADDQISKPEVTQLAQRAKALIQARSGR